MGTSVHANSFGAILMNVSTERRKDGKFVRRAHTQYNTKRANHVLYLFKTFEWLQQQPVRQKNEPAPKLRAGILTHKYTYILEVCTCEFCVTFRRCRRPIFVCPPFPFCEGPGQQDLQLRSMSESIYPPHHLCLSSLVEPVPPLSLYSWRV